MGIDVGILSFATLSDAQFILNPRLFNTEKKALVKAIVSSKSRKRNTRKSKVSKSLCGVYERIANKEMIYSKLSKVLVDSYG